VLRLVKLKQWIGANNTWQLATMASALALERRDNLPAYSRTDVDSTCKVHQNPFLKESATFLYPMRDIHSVATPSIKVEFSMNTTKFGPSPTPPTSPPRSWWRWAWPSPSSPNDPPQWSKKGGQGGGPPTIPHVAGTRAGACRRRARKSPWRNSPP
jgi:hypothetical protein